MGAREERGAGKKERGGARGDLSIEGKKEKSGDGVGSCGETTPAYCQFQQRLSKAGTL